MGRCWMCSTFVAGVVMCVVGVPVVGLPEELYVDQIRGFGDALSVRLHEVCV